jgi:hypothetical protein
MSTSPFGVEHDTLSKAAGYRGLHALSEMPKGMANARPRNVPGSPYRATHDAVKPKFGRKDHTRFDQPRYTDVGRVQGPAGQHRAGG